MKKPLLTIITFAIIGLNNLVDAQAPNWAWARSAGGKSDDWGLSIATDASGNIFMTGPFNSDSIIFGTITLTNNGSTDFFIVKYDAFGNVLWANSEGGTKFDLTNSVCTDASGNVFVTGSFSDTITIGTTTLTNTGGFDIFIVKYDASGNVLWAKSAGGTYSEEGYSLATDASGNVFMTGYFYSDSITFGTTTLFNSTPPGPLYYADIFIVKYDANGNVLWAKSAGGTDEDEGLSVATDASGNVFMTGYFSNSITFGTTTLNNAGNSDIFIVKYDASGNVLWANSEGGTGTEWGNSVATDTNGNVFMTGSFASDSIIFGTTTLTNTGGFDIFIVKYDASGNVLWANSEGGSGTEEGQSVATDANGSVFITGSFSSQSIIFGLTTLTNIGGFDIFIVKYDATGSVLWAKNEGGTNADVGFCVATNTNGNVLITGAFWSTTITFGTTTLTNADASYHDIFIAKLDGTTGLESTENTNSFSIYPNPISDVLTISNGQLTIGKTVTISISDIAGKVLYNSTSTATEKMEVNTKDFAVGVYLVQVQTKDFVETRKVIVGR